MLRQRDWSATKRSYWLTRQVDAHSIPQAISSWQKSADAAVCPEKNKSGLSNDLFSQDLVGFALASHRPRLPFRSREARATTSALRLLAARGRRNSCALFTLQRRAFLSTAVAWATHSLTTTITHKRLAGIVA